MDDDYEAIDWLSNNMNYIDFEDEITVVKKDNSVEIDWCNAEKEIIEKEEAQND